MGAIGGEEIDVEFTEKSVVVGGNVTDLQSEVVGENASAIDFYDAVFSTLIAGRGGQFFFAGANEGAAEFASRAILSVFI